MIELDCRVGKRQTIQTDQGLWKHAVVLYNSMYNMSLLYGAPEATVDKLQEHKTRQLVQSWGPIVEPMPNHYFNNSTVFQDSSFDA